MSININMVNVGDADAIIVTLKEKGKTAVVLIDGGSKKYSKRVLKCLEKILTHEGKKTPDLIVCTHCDGDHIGGIIEIVKEYKGNIKEIWIHQLTEAIKPVGVYLEEVLNSSYQSSERTLGHVTIDEAELLKETIDQFRTLCDLINEYKIPSKQPFGDTKNNFLKEFPEFKVIGPTKDFYNKITQEVQTKGAALLLEEGLLFDNKQKLLTDIIDEVFKNNLEPCDRLKYSTKQNWLNTLSIIILYTDADGKKYLFPGEAGIDSFENIPGYKTLLNDIFYMTLPHHGSKNNVSKQLIEIMKPKVVFISASGENVHPDKDVVECLERHGAEVYQTYCIDLNQLLKGRI